jgi:FkbM family methyltransferase
MYPYKSSHIDYFQIGAHIGNTVNDPIYFNEMVDKNIILIEPVHFLYKLLKNNYSERIRENEIEFLNIAVSNTDGNIEMTVPCEDNDFNNHPFFLNQMSSTTDKYIKKFNFSSRFPDFKFEKISVICKRFNTIVQERGIKTIDYLIIDTEGHDYTILMDIDFNLVKPKKIRFENCYTDEDRSKTNYNRLINHLKSIGYSIIEENEEDTTIELISL